MGDRDVVGSVGRVVTRLRGTVGPGEVRVLVRGCYETVIAYSDSVLERGEHVLVVHRRGPGSVDVVPWPAPPLDDADIPDGPGREEGGF